MTVLIVNIFEYVLSAEYRFCLCRNGQQKRNADQSNKSAASVQQIVDIYGVFVFFGGTIL